MFEDINPESNLTEAIVNHYKEVLGVDNFKDPKDLERLRKQVQFDIIDMQLRREEEVYYGLINK